jgi:hypothetical protein
MITSIIIIIIINDDDNYNQTSLMAFFVLFLHFFALSPLCAIELHGAGSTSCTVYLEGQPRCVRDGGVWRGCPAGSTADVFTRDICRIYQKSHSTLPSECQNQIVN